MVVAIRSDVAISAREASALESSQTVAKEQPDSIMSYWQGNNSQDKEEWQKEQWNRKGWNEKKKRNDEKEEKEWQRADQQESSKHEKR